jgi:hypothetical protein
MTSTKKQTRAKTLAQVQAFIAGIQKRFPTATLTIGNTSFAAPALVGLFQSLIDAMAKQAAARVAAKDALTALRVVQLQVDPVIQGFKELLVATFGSATEPLADFGLAPRKVRAPLSVEQKAAAKARRKATRDARGTKGPKAKLTIKGEVATAPAAPATPPEVAGASKPVA